MEEESRYNHVSGQLPDALRQLWEENVRLKALLEANGIPWDESAPSEENSSEIPTTSPVQRSAIEKVALFGQPLRGRRDALTQSPNCCDSTISLWTFRMSAYQAPKYQ